MGRASIVLVLLVVGLSGPLRAEEEEGEGVYAADDVYRADEILVETELLSPAEVYLDTPVETEVITAEELRVLPGTNPIDALDAIPGIRIQRQVQGQRGAVRIDGLPPEFTEILVNGQRYSGENGEAIDLGDQLFANIERIEILRGPQALRYSPRAAGGVINFITADPPREGFNTVGEAGGGDQGQGEFEATVGWGRPSFGANLTYDYNQIDGFNDPNPDSNDPDDGLASPFGEGSRYQTHDVYATIQALPRDDVELKTRLGYRLRDEEFALEDGPVTSRRKVNRYLVSQEGRLSLSESTEFVGALTFSYEDTESSVGRNFDLTDDLTRLQLGIEQAHEIGPTFHVLTIGIDASTNGLEVDERGLPEGIDNPDLTLDDTEERTAEAGGFLVVESDWTEWLQSELGVRYQTREGFKPELLPQGSLLARLWRWDDERSLKLRVSAGRAVRYPTLRELYQPPVPQLGGAYFLAGNEDLDSETAFAVRAGLEANPARWISGSVVGFYSETSDRIRSFFRGNTIQVGTSVIPADPFRCNVLGQIEFCTDQITPINANVFENGNIDDLRSYGVEARLELRPWDWIEVAVGYTWNRNKVDDSNVQIDELPNSPEHIVNGRVTLTAPVTQTLFTIRGSWRDKAIIENSGTGLLSFAIDETSNTSYEIDLRLLQPLEPWLGRRIDLFADVRNVNDNRVVDSTVVRGRSFFVGLKWNLDHP